MSSYTRRALILCCFCWFTSTLIFAQSTVNLEPTEILESRYQKCNSKSDLERIYSRFSQRSSSLEQRFLNEITFAKMLSKYGYHTEALNFLKSHSKTYKTAPPLVHAEYLATLGTISYNSENPELAEKYVKQSIYTLKANDIEKGLTAKYSLLVSIDVALNKNDQALNDYQSGKKYVNSASKRTQLYLEMNLAVAYMAMNRLEDAKKQFQEALRWHKKAMSPIAEIRTYGNLAEIYMKQDSLEMALTLLTKGLKLAESKGLQLEQIRSHYALYQLAESQERWQQSIVHLKKYHEVREHVDIQTATEKTKDLELTHQKRMAKEMAAQERIKLQLKQQQNKWLIFTSITLTGLLLVILRFLQLTRKKNTILLQKTLELARRPSAEKLVSKVSSEDYSELIQAFENYVISKGKYAQTGLTMDVIAKKIGTNRSYLSEAINTHYQVNFNKWLNQIRIEKSIPKLIDKSYDHYSIEGIASEVGFSSISVFNTNFKRITGLTPSYFRDKAKNH